MNDRNVGNLSVGGASESSGLRWQSNTNDYLRIRKLQFILRVYLVSNGSVIWKETCFDVILFERLEYDGQPLGLPFWST